MPLKNLKNVHPMNYAATSQAEVNLIKEINDPMKALFDLIDDRLPESPDKTVVLRKLTEFRTEVNKAIVLNGVK